MIVHYLGAGRWQGSGLPAGAGAVIGGLLVHLLTLPGVGRLPVVLISAAWPAAVGGLSCRLSLHREVEATPARGATAASEHSMQGRSERRRTGVVEALGLAVTVASVLSLLLALT